MKGILLIMPLLAGCYTLLLAQQPFFRPHPFERISTQSAQTFSQDSKGFLWIAADSKLYRYDGSSFQLYDVDVSQAISVIFQDGDLFYLGLVDGTVVRGHPYNSWNELNVPKGSRVTGMVMDGEDHLWISTYGGGIILYEEDESTQFMEEDGLLDNQIYTISIDSRGQIWAASDAGCNIISWQGDQVNIESLSRFDGLRDEIVYQLEPSGEGMWIGFQSAGLSHFSNDTERIDFSTLSWPYGEILSLCAIGPGRVWAGTLDAGIVEVDLEEEDMGQIFVEEGNPGPVSVIDIDRNENVWLLTGTHGIWSTFPRVRTLRHTEGDVQALLRDQQGQTWVGTQNGLYNLIEGKLIPFQKVRANVLSLYEDDNHFLWIGTFGRGLICLSPDRNQQFLIDEKDGLANGSILSITGKGNQLWLGTLGGVSEVRINSPKPSKKSLSFQNYDRSSGIDADFIYRAYRDREGVMWFGTDGKGVVKLDEQSVVNLLEEEILPIKTVYSFAERGTELWMAAPGDGLYKFAGEIHRKYGLEDGLTSLSVSGIAVDLTRLVFAVHDEGIDILDPDRGLVAYLGYNEGLDNFNPPLGAVYSDSSGLWFGGQDVIVHYQSGASESLNYPQVVFDDIRVLDRPIKAAENRFRHLNNFITFHLASNWLSNPTDVTYRYMLDGYDLDWKSTGDQIISYSRLSPGSYSMKVEAQLKGRPVAASRTEYRFTILRPVWQRDWFVGLAALVLVGLFYLYKKRIENNISREAKIQRERIESQYEVLKAQINPHFLFNSFNTLANLVDEDSELAIEYIEKLSDYYRSIIQLRDQKVISLKQEIELIDDYTYLLKKRFGDNITIRNQLNGVDGFVPPLTIQMLVENAVKHNVISKRKPLTIEIFSDGEELVVENNYQPKLTIQESTNFGLQSIKNRYELLSKRTIDVIQTDKIFKVKIPIIRKLIK